MLAQAATASTGIVDTIVIGLHGSKEHLGAVGIGAVVVNFLYWACGFLRMSTTGLTAQASGAGKPGEVYATLQRALLIGAILGTLLLLLSPLLGELVFRPFDTTGEVKRLAREYWAARLWGAPAQLMGYAITGWLLGTGRTGQLLVFQVVLNGSNAALDAAFVAWLDMGPAGIGAGTALAEWIALGVGLLLVRRALRPISALRQRDAVIALFRANRDILVRTLALLFSFAWFVNSGAGLGTAVLAGNEVLVQFIAVAAFVLDGMAFVAEKEIGEAYGARSRARLLRAMRITTELALGFGAAIALLYVTGGSWAITRFIADADARSVALTYLPYCALVPLIGVPCWQLDGFFLGATQGNALRNASMLAVVVYIATDLVLSASYGNHGVWIAFLLLYLYRAVALGVYLPSLMRKSSARPAASD